MSFLSPARLVPAVQNMIPTIIRDSFTTACQTLSEKVDFLHRGVSAYAFKPPADASQELRYLGSRAQFINPTFHQFLKAFIFFGIPTGLSIRALHKVRLGTLIPAPTLITAIIGLVSLTEFAGFLRLKFRGNELERALRTIVVHGQAGKTLETLPRLNFVNGRVDMGAHSIGVVANPHSERIDYVAFRYVENIEGMDKIHTRVYSLGGHWIKTGTTCDGNHFYDVSTSLEGRLIENLVVAAKGEPLAVNIPPPQPAALLQRGSKGIIRFFTPDTVRQKCSLIGQEILKSIHVSYWGKSAFIPSENKKSAEIRFLSTRDKFVNLTSLQLLKTLLFFGPVSFICIRHLVNLKLGPYMPFTASLAAYIGTKCLKQLAGTFLQYLSGNDLERALIAIVQTGAPSVHSQPGRTVLDALPTEGNLSAIKTAAGKTTHVKFVYREGSREISRTFFVGRGWFRTGTSHPAGNIVQNATSLESSHIEKLLEAVQAFHAVNVLPPPQPAIPKSP